MNSRPNTTHRPHILRYLAAMFYDCLLLVAVWFFATAIAVMLNSGEAIKDNPFFIVYLFAISFLFYGWFWTHGGQTLGMQSWKIQLVSTHGNQITWQQAGLRFITAIIAILPCGIGLFWRWFGKDLASWQDVLSHTSLHQRD